MEHSRSGRTTRQMQAASEGAVFVWCNTHLSYPKLLAHKLGRDDLKIISPHGLELERYLRGRKSVVVDHAAQLNEAARRVLDSYRRRF